MSGVELTLSTDPSNPVLYLQGRRLLGRRIHQVRVRLQFVISIPSRKACLTPCSVALNFYTYGVSALYSLPRPPSNGTLAQNRHGSWELAQSQGNFTVPAPALSILPTRDPVANWVLAAKLLKSGQLVPKLTTEVRRLVLES